MKNIFLGVFIVLAFIFISTFPVSADDESFTPCAITSFKAVPAAVASGGSSNLSWSTTGCMSHAVTQGTMTLINSPFATGSVGTGPLTSTKVYLLTAVGDTNTVTATAKVTVGTPSVCMINSFTANPLSVPYNAASMFTWTTTNCSAVSINQGIPPIPTSGSISSGNLTATTTFTLTASNASSSASASKTITVIPPPQCMVTLFNATPQTITYGQPTTLNWKTTNCDTGTIDQNVGSITANIVQGSFTTVPLMQTTVFKLTAFGAANTTVASTTVNVATPACTSNTWTQKTDFGGGVRYEAVSFTIGSKGYMGTGAEGYNNYKKDFWEYDPTANTWTQKADFGGSERHGSVGFAIGNKGYIGTGNGMDDAFYKDFWEYNQNTNTWTQKADFGGTSRDSAVGFALSGKGYVGTGFGGTSGGAKKDFWQYDPSADTWTQKADFGGSARYDAVGFTIATKGYLGTGFGNGYKKDFWQYDPSADTWTQKADFGGSARYHPVGFAINSKGYIGTGHDITTSYKKDFWEYNSTTNSWTQKADFGGTGRHFAKGFVINGRGYMGTGEDAPFSNVKDIWEYCQ